GGDRAGDPDAALGGGVLGLAAGDGGLQVGAGLAAAGGGPARGGRGRVRGGGALAAGGGGQPRVGRVGVRAVDQVDDLAVREAVLHRLARPVDQDPDRGAGRGRGDRVREVDRGRPGRV